MNNAEVNTRKAIQNMLSAIVEIALTKIPKDEGEEVYDPEYRTKEFLRDALEDGIAIHQSDERHFPK